MHRRRRQLLVAVLVGVSLTAAACGSSNKTNTNAQDATSTTSGVTITVPKSSGVTGDAISDPAKLPTSMDDWEKLWASQRAAIVKRIKDNHWGVSADGKTLTGPEGFTIDLSKCPQGWTETEGITDNEIKIGQTLAESGTFAVAANYGKGEDAIFKHYSDQGAFTDVNGKSRKVTYIQKDDGYDTAKTVPLTDELLDSDKVFAQQTLGSPNIMKV